MFLWKDITAVHNAADFLFSLHNLMLAACTANTHPKVCLHMQRYPSCSRIQAWRRRKRRKKMTKRKAQVRKSKATRTVCSLVLALLTHMPQTTAASCFQSWWPLECLSPHSSAYAGYRRPGANFCFFFFFF